MKEIIFFKDQDIQLEVPFSPEKETVWLSANQMAKLI